MIRKDIQLAIRCALALVRNEIIRDRATAIVWATQVVPARVMRTSSKWSSL